MGGTSFDACLIDHGVPDVKGSTDVHRYRLAAPMVNINTIGAGGGSLAWIDHGILRIGPQSAEAVPGPACYMRGGSEPTVTDADGKKVPQSKIVVEGEHVPVKVSLAPGEVLQLRSRLQGTQMSYVLKPADLGGRPTAGKLGPLYVGTGNVTLQYQQVLGDSSAGQIAVDPVLKKLATGNVKLQVQTVEKRKEETAWGKEVGGVQVGIRFGEDRVYKIGETVTLIVRLRNNGKKDVPLVSDEEYFQKNPPLITDADGKAAKIKERHIFGLIEKSSVAPGKETDLCMLTLHLRPDTDRKKGELWTLYGTGKFHIQYKDVPVVETRLDGPVMTHATGKLELDVRESR